MSCFRKLTSGNFLKNLTKEIEQAQDLVHAGNYEPVGGVYLVDPRERKKLYDFFVDHYNIRTFMDDVDPEIKDMIYCIQEDSIVWIASRSKLIVDQSIKNSLSLTGDIPIFKGKQYIQGRLFHVVMYDLTFQLIPPTTN